MKVKNVIKDLKENFDRDERKEILENMLNGETDFEVSGYRFIDKNEIDEILKNELVADTYMLGCFNAYFIADITGLTLMAVEKAQKSGSYEILGELMKHKIDEVVEGYISADGYGHHFSHYDGSENETDDYYYFRVS